MWRCSTALRRAIQHSRKGHEGNRALPLSHGMRVDVMAGRYEVSPSVVFGGAKVLDVSLHDVLAGTALPPGVCKHCGRPA